ncbi:RelA/SpoT domain-containing protein [Clostridium beijerinckii]|uniref:RelA/SpoT domain-containing protein n=1 Tax=Clostridium beijerinckii TaxID=1520 RepID=UPI00242F0C1E|nr:RelA/SpoT domain-containing protein [Clostridium beijerinckii]MDG5852451.1 RelA/SpoT domain-containing protein [Clostridium beijerinckii]
MSIINRFLERYSKEYDYYLEAAKLCAQQCENGLEANGIRAIVTFRAKRPDRLKDKLEKRNETKRYRRVEDIYKDIVDLAGVRIAVYFPSDKEEVDKFIKASFSVFDTKNFPEKRELSYEKRFSGYWANHYRLNLNDGLLLGTGKRYSQAKIEIQVASVLMHAWSEVEHDLVYKPLSGNLSEEEYAILDELNGLVLTGEIALERLQKAVKLRAGEKGKKFNNHYELSAYLYDKTSDIINVKGNEPIMGRIDVLHRFLQLVELDKPECLEQFVSQLDSNTERRPIADQLVDYILTGDEQLYQLYNKARIESGNRSPYGTKQEKLAFLAEERSLGYFISRWIIFENVIREITKDKKEKNFENPMISLRKLLNAEMIDKNIYKQIDVVRRLRNEVIHGIQIPQEEQLIEAANYLVDILDYLLNTVSNELKPVVLEGINEIRKNYFTTELEERSEN